MEKKRERNIYDKQQGDWVLHPSMNYLHIFFLVFFSCFLKVQIGIFTGREKLDYHIRSLLLLRWDATVIFWRQRRGRMVSRYAVRRCG